MESNEILINVLKDDQTFRNYLQTHQIQKCYSYLEQLCRDEGISFKTVSDFTQLCYEKLNIDVLTFLRSIPPCFGYDDLERITIPSHITSIGYNAFEFCTNLYEVVIEEGCTEILESAFYECTKLKSITIPRSVRHIGSYAFYNCYKLDTIIYNGTKDEWNHIPKQSKWDYNTNEPVVSCVDGEIILK